MFIIQCILYLYMYSSELLNGKNSFAWEILENIFTISFPVSVIHVQNVFKFFFSNWLKIMNQYLFVNDKNKSQENLIC